MAERISHQISNKGMTLLTAKDNDNEWAKRWKEYVTDKKKVNVWNLENFDRDKSVTDKALKINV